MVRRRKKLAAMAAAVLGMAGVSEGFAAQPQGWISTMGLTGAPYPGGTQYYDFAPNIELNDLGQVAFQATIDPNFTQTGVFRAAELGPAKLIAKTGQGVVNGMISGLTLGDLNNSGEVLVQAELAGTPGGATDDRALYVGGATPLRQMVREGSSFLPAHITTQRFDYRLSSMEELNPFEGSQLNDAGQVSFVGGFTAKTPVNNGSVNVSGYAAMRVNPDGSVNMAFERGQAAPLAGGGTQGTIDDFTGMAPFYFKTALVNNQGHVLVRAQNGGAVDGGFYWSNVASLPFHNRQRTVGRDGQTLIPGAPGSIEVLSGEVPLLLTNGVDMNDVGEVAFVPQVNPGQPGKAPEMAVYRWSPTAAAQAGAHGLTEIARTGMAIAGTDSELGYTFFADVELNNAGQVAFQSQLKNVSQGATENAIFRGDGNELIPIVRDSMATPDGLHYFGLFGTNVLANDIAINDSGHVAFQTPLRDKFGDYAGQGLYITDGIDMIEVTREGRELAGSTVSFMQWNGAPSLNKHGQVAFNATLEDGRAGVFMFTPDRLEWRTAGDGSWDDAKNWTLGTQPSELHHLYIRPKASAVVEGPMGDLVVNSLRLGDREERGSIHELRIRAGSSIKTLQNIVLEPSARVVLELGGVNPDQYGHLITDGDFHLDGELQVTLAEGFQQAAGQQFHLLQAIGMYSLGIFGEFVGVKLPEAAPELIWSTDRLTTHGLLVSTWQADFDEDGDVDGADLATWKAGSVSEGLGTHRKGDANGDGLVNGSDYLVWQRQQGMQAPQPAIGAVPEPGSLLLGLLGMGVVAAIRRR